MTKLLKAWTCRPATKVGEEIDQTELKTDPGEELEITDYILSNYCEGVLSGARSMTKEPLFKTPLGP